MDKTTKQASHPDERVMESNTFGEDLEDNLPELEPRGSVSRPYVYDPDEHITISYDSSPEKKLAAIEEGYIRVPPGDNIVLECSFRLKSTFGSSDFFAKSRFHVWSNRSTNPTVYYWERKDFGEEPGPFKYGPFKNITDTFEAIRDLYGFRLLDIERVK